MNSGNDTTAAAPAASASAAKKTATSISIRDLIFDGEGDMRKVYDLALILHDYMSDVEPIGKEMQGALTWITSDLVALGQNIAKHQDALFAAIDVGGEA